MKIVKSVLLGTAAGFVTVAGVQAADLPVKAKPIEFVKVCSIYGAGFYYIPGTDICMKIGGFMRAQYTWNQGTNTSLTSFTGANAQQTRLFNAANDFNIRSSVRVSFDTRQQTEYGVLRTYLMTGFDHQNGSAAVGGSAPSLFAGRGFIQLAGFTLGKALSFYDFFEPPAYGYIVSHNSSTGDGGINLAAYTAFLGNGVSATISTEDPRRLVVVNTAIPNSFTVGNNPTSDTGNIRWPDVVGSLRADQAWGSAAIMGAVHDASGGYYGTTLTGSTVNGHPSDEVGFAVGGGARVKLDFLSPGDHFSFQVNYAEGANRYVAHTVPGGGSLARFGSGNSLGVGWWTDGVFGGSIAAGTATEVELTTAWGVAAGYDHKWNPKWQTSAYGGIIDFRYNDTAKGLICANVNAATGANTIGAVTGGATGCDPNFGIWWVGSRTQWNVTKDFYVGFDVMYVRLNTAFEGTATYTAATGLPRPTGPYRIEDQDAVVVGVRANRNFLP